MNTESPPFYQEKKVFPASFESLKEIGDFVRRASGAAGFDISVAYSIQLAVDEACSNIVEHAYHSIRGMGEIECTCAVDGHALYIELHDHGEPFSPAEIPPPNTTSDLSTRAKGGLGLYFIRQLMDEVKFHFEPANSEKPMDSSGNFLVLIKHKEKAA